MSRKRFLALIVVSLIVILTMTACGAGPEPASPTQALTSAESGELEHDEEGEHKDEAEHDDEAEHADEHDDDDHMDEDEHMDEHMEGAHDVPDEAAGVQNPIEATDESVSMGAELYANNCAVCHGEEGEGDGPTAASLDPAPADLHEDHVQGLTDGGLYYIISHGRPETAMPAWEESLSEDERWHVVNFMRTFQE